MNIPSENTLEMDIVIVGGGGSGLAAALSAKDAGADRIIILEKKGALGGNSLIASGMFGAGSPVQQRLGINVCKDEMFRFAMVYSHWELNQRLVRAWLNKSGETIQWFEKMGVKFIEPITPWYVGQKDLVFHKVDGGGGEAIKALTNNCESKGIQILLKTEVKKILIGENGQAVGVLAANQEQELRINAKVVIIGTGGFAGNKEMLKEYYPHYNENLVNHGLPHMGDGIRLALEIGANTEGLGRILGHGPFFSDSYPKSRPLWNTSLEPDTILVNNTGERYTNEDLPLNPTESMNPLNRQPDKMAYCLLDERKKQSIMYEGVYKQAGLNTYPGKKWPELDEQMQSQVSKGNVKISDSWDDIAGWIGADTEVLKSTIEEYNLFCNQGYDETFAKDPRYLMPLQSPPYYAIRLNPSLLNTLGGIKINHMMQVLDKQDKAIQGLYAVGVDTGGWAPEIYNIRLSGSALSFAYTSGRIAGENAAKIVSR